MLGYSMKGYSHPDYANSLSEFGTPRALPRCGGWILERPIPGFTYQDAMGCYPLFSCEDWSGLHPDLEEIGDDLVSLALVTDPFGNYDLAALRRSLGLVKPFKEHYVADLRRPLNEIVGKRHRKNAHRALRSVQVDVCEEPIRYLEEWTMLYGNLIEKHNISGVQAFSRESFAKQLSIPGATMLRATGSGTTVGAQIYFMHGDVAHCHLGAVSQRGYELGAFFAMDLYSIEYFAEKANWLNLGGGAGVTCDGTDGLSLYKKGWATETRTSYFCGRIFDEARYAELAKCKGAPLTDYFPAYRKGEFGEQRHKGSASPAES